MADLLGTVGTISNIEHVYQANQSLVYNNKVKMT